MRPLRREQLPRGKRSNRTDPIGTATRFPPFRGHAWSDKGDLFETQPFSIGTVDAADLNLIAWSRTISPDWKTNRILKGLPHCVTRV